MAGFTDYLENKILDHVFRNTSYTPPATVYVALFTAAPSDSGGGTEVSGTAYARQSATFGAAASGAIANTGAVTFPVAGSSWGTATHFAIFDAATSGNMLAWNALNSSKVIASGDTASFQIGDLDVTLD